MWAWVCFLNIIIWVKSLSKSKLNHTHTHTFIHKLNALPFVPTYTGFIDQEKDAAPVWWLEGSSYPIEILDKRRVKVLVRSDDLKKRYKHDPVIVRFDWGKGTVYHMISHFYLQRSETRTKKQCKNVVVMSPLCKGDVTFM